MNTTFEGIAKILTHTTTKQMDTRSWTFLGQKIISLKEILAFVKATALLRALHAYYKVLDPCVLQTEALGETEGIRIPGRKESILLNHFSLQNFWHSNSLWALHRVRETETTIPVPSRC